LQDSETYDAVLNGFPVTYEKLARTSVAFGYSWTFQHFRNLFDFYQTFDRTSITLNGFLGMTNRQGTSFACLRFFTDDVFF